ncbi:putative glycosidase CRH2 [Entomophthora muscae]|uniref:Glycosidase CRH2 n=1 Tax=Entomophthora muscae TaxID=34485 RepID=A0ACC2T922_9FUNG|nr:putative glycosidase CRH2 [Entomophthora muscae]
MFHKIILITFWVLELAAANANKKCHVNLGVCDKWSPCCNTSGWCGTGFQHCGSTCFQPGNYKGVRCLPDPKCKTKRYKISPSRVSPISRYTGNYTKTDFIVEGDYAVKNKAMILKMSKPNTGTTIHSTRYMHYGRVSAKIKTSRTGGVVSSFILMAKDKDEIDFEWVGNKQTETQTNWYSKGRFPIWPKTNGENYPTRNTHSRFRKYTIDWSPKRIKWFIDGKVVRTLPKTDHRYPTSPARFSFGIWDGGSGAEGTRQWAGGYVNWKAPDIKRQGYFDVQVKDIQVKCYR